jgi:hypothetical protein
VAKTYPLKALWPLLPFEVAAAPLLATLDAYGGGLVKYAVSQDGIWLFSPSQPLTAHESETLTGFHPADLVPKQIDGLAGYFYALQGGVPLLPLPFTAAQLMEFDKRAAGLIASCIERGTETDAWITDMEKDNPDAAELARGIHGGKWPVAPVKPRFHLAGDIVPNASAGAAKSAFDQVQLQQDALRLSGISSMLMNDIKRCKEYEKLINPTSIADAAYMQATRATDAMFGATSTSASQTAADLLSQQRISMSAADDVMAKIYGSSQFPTELDIDKLTGRSMGSVAEAMYLREQEDLLATLGHKINPSLSHMMDQTERLGIEKVMLDSKARDTEIEFTPPRIYDFRADEERRQAREREHTVETARLAEIARLEVQDAHEAKKRAYISAPAEKLEPANENEAARPKKLTWRDVAMPYLLAKYKGGQYTSAKIFYRALESDAQDPASRSPFDMGIGANRGSLFVREIGVTVSAKTVANAMSEIREMASK